MTGRPAEIAPNDRRVKVDNSIRAGAVDHGRAVSNIAIEQVVQEELLIEAQFSEDDDEADDAGTGRTPPRRTRGGLPSTER
jgi:uncharacterized GH25 family protein